MNPPRRLAVDPSAGFSLVEVTLALGIAVFCMVVVFGLLTVGLNSSSLSVEQTTATNLLSVVASDLRTAPKSVPNTATPSPSAYYHLTIPPSAMSSPANTQTFKPYYLDVNGKPSLDGNGQPVALADAAGARYRMNITMKPGVGREATLARVVLSWPPGAKAAAGSVETVVALDRN